MQKFFLCKCHEMHCFLSAFTAHCTANSLAEVLPSHQSVGFIYKWANRRLDDSFHARGEQITVQKNWIRLSSWALILCHWISLILLRSEQGPLFHFSFQWDTRREVCPELIGVECAVRVWRSDSQQKTIGSTAALSPRLTLPTHHMYNFVLRWVS